MSSSGPQEKESLSDLYRSPTLRNRLLNVNFNWVVITLVYYGLSMNASSLAGDVFTNFTLLSVAEFPGYLLSYLGMCLVGRRATLAASLLIGGLACLAASLTPGLLYKHSSTQLFPFLHRLAFCQEECYIICYVKQRLCLLLEQPFTCLASLAPLQLLGPHTSTLVSYFQQGR